ncbi:MAG: hypothetical protein FWG81_05455 [Betaproteobacteria bacterium]|nr:hypothetical protein [Betaproteobacteria bacterium]
MAMIDPAGLQAAVHVNNPQIAAANLLSNPSGAAAVARNESQETREKTATPLQPSTQVNISESGRARLQAEQTNAIATPEMAQAGNAPQAARSAPVASVTAPPDIRNDSMLTAAAPTGLPVGGASAQGMSADPVTATPASANPASPIAPVVSAAPGSVASSDNMAAAPANPGTPRAEYGRQQAEAQATQAQAQQSDDRANRQDTSPVLAQGGAATYRGIFSS